ncbi:MAG: hypothetical protein D6820_10885 [Lentisphaerae bacterium]|nr:MAG: hypothetical protein D6820_10885 [Lentisphaerota bacterium]
MREVLAVAESVWRRMLGMKVVYFLVGCGILLTWITVLYKYLMAYEEKMLMVDVSLVVTAIGGLLCVLSLAFEVPCELREGAATTLLSKPLGRTQYLVGKFIGIVIVGLVVTGILTVGFCVLFRLNYPKENLMVPFKAHLLTMFSVLPMAAIAVLFSFILNEAPAAILTFLAIFLFNSLGELPFASKMSWLIGGILPDLTFFNLRSEAAHPEVLQTPLGWSYVLMVLAWAVVYSVALLAVSGVIFNRRDLH